MPEKLVIDPELRKATYILSQNEDAIDAQINLASHEIQAPGFVESGGCRFSHAKPAIFAAYVEPVSWIINNMFDQPLDEPRRYQRNTFERFEKDLVRRAQVSAQEFIRTADTTTVTRLEKAEALRAKATGTLAPWQESLIGGAEAAATWLPRIYRILGHASLWLPTELRQERLQSSHGPAIEMASLPLSILRVLNVAYQTNEFTGGDVNPSNHLLKFATNPLDLAVNRPMLDALHERGVNTVGVQIVRDIPADSRTVGCPLLMKPRQAATMWKRTVQEGNRRQLLAR